MSSSEYHHFVMMTMIIAYIFHNDFTFPSLPLSPICYSLPYTYHIKAITTHATVLSSPTSSLCIFFFVTLRNHCCAFILQARKPMGAISSSQSLARWARLKLQSRSAINCLPFRRSNFRRSRKVIHL